MQQLSVSTLTGARLYGSPKLRELLQTHQKTISQQMSHASDVRMFLSDLTNLLVGLLDQAAHIMPCVCYNRKISTLGKDIPKYRNRRICKYKKDCINVYKTIRNANQSTEHCWNGKRSLHGSCLKVLPHINTVNVNLLVTFSHVHSLIYFTGTHLGDNILFI